MNGAFYIGATGLDTQQRALDVIANNIANLNTPGFRRSTVRFSELVSVPRDGNDLPIAAADGSAGMSGVQLASSTHVWTAGDLRQTGSSMDVAIDGDGFLEMMGPSGQILLTRGGTLKVNTDGYLAGADGTPLRAMISVPQGTSQLTINPDGTVLAASQGEAAHQIGQIELVMAKDPDALVDRGGGYYEALDDADLTAARPGLDGAGSLAQGAIEQGNVNLSDEMVTLMLVQRAYSASAQVVQAGDQLMAITNGLRR
ncbi:MAG TPA: flagellar hook basal-body protein [Acetobacteraceae bacterium]|nr:flagellar hook basal-body protein [Acetobacteraceae bacterium]